MDVFIKYNNSEKEIYIYMFVCVCVYIYIYIYSFFEEKTKDRLFYDYKFISILFYVSDVNQKHEEKYNRTSSDPIDK